MILIIFMVSLFSFSCARYYPYDFNRPYSNYYNPYYCSYYLYFQQGKGFLISQKKLGYNFFNDLVFLGFAYFDFNKTFSLSNNSYLFSLSFKLNLDSFRNIKSSFDSDKFKFAFESLEASYTFSVSSIKNLVNFDGFLKANNLVFYSRGYYDSPFLYIRGDDGFYRKTLFNLDYFNFHRNFLAFYGLDSFQFYHENYKNPNSSLKVLNTDLYLDLNDFFNYVFNNFLDLSNLA